MVAGSVLEKLSYDEGRVLEVTVASDKKTVKLDEACDFYFSVVLTKKEFGALIDELLLLHHDMEYEE